MQYINKIKEKLGIEFEGLKRGEEFLEFFSQELNNLELKTKGATKLVVKDKFKNKFFLLRVAEKEFQNELQQLYKKFVRDKFLKKYQWYNKFLLSISNTLRLKFFFEKNNKNHIEMTEFFYESLTTIFLINCNIQNTFEYQKIAKSMFEMLNAVGFDFNQSIEIRDKFLDGFIKDGLILIETKNFINQYKIFSLSDPCISIVFGVTSMFLPDVFAKNEHSIEFNPEFQLINLEFYLENFKIFVENYDSFNIYRNIILEKNPEFLQNLDNYNNINSFDFYGFDQNDQQAITIMYFMKLVVNEFCFQTVVMSCFKSYYYTLGVKNILFSSQILDLKLYKNC